jgi:hypothetical protein
MLSIEELLPIQMSVVPVIVKKARKPYKQQTHGRITELTNTSTISASSIDNILENEKQQNIKDTWNKLDKTVKIQKLTMYATKYCDENKSDLYDTDILIKFFKSSLENNKLQKKKDIVYDNDFHKIISIPSLVFQVNCFILKNLDNKRVSTLKSLTPKRVS